MDNFLALHPKVPGSIPGIPKVFSEINCLGEEIVDIARLIDSAAAESSRQQRLNHIDQTHLALVSGKLVQQKLCELHLNLEINEF